MNDDKSDSSDEEYFDFEISKEQASRNYSLAGLPIKEAPDEINMMKYEHLILNDFVDRCIKEVLNEKRLPFNLSDMQMISLHVLGNKQNLILISPTGC